VSYTIQSFPGHGGVPLAVLDQIANGLAGFTQVVQLSCAFHVHLSHLAILRRVSSLHSLTLGNATNEAIQSLESFLPALNQLKHFFLDVSVLYDVPCQMLNATLAYSRLLGWTLLCLRS
jgi:hypothetical protein